MSQPSLFTPEDLIFQYTRSQAIEDGVLIDVSEMAREAGFQWPVAVTAGVWALVNDIPPRYRGLQDPDGRLWDVLWMASWAARRAKISYVSTGPPHTAPSEFLYLETHLSRSVHYLLTKIPIIPIPGIQTGRIAADKEKIIFP